MNSSVTTAGIAQSLKVSRRNALKMITMGMVFGLATTPFAPASSGHAADVKGKKTLIVYFSMPETNNPDNMTREEDNSVVVIDGKVLGNTQYVAQLIQEMTGGDISAFCRRNRIPQTTVPLSIWPRESRNRTPARSLRESSKLPKPTTPSLSGIQTGGATCR